MSDIDSKPNLLAYGAAALGAAAAANLLLGKNAEQKYPPNGRLLTIDGVQVHAIEKGSGSPIVLLHGNASLAEDFRISGLFDLLAADHRVIAFDRPGNGYSDRPRDREWTAEAQAELLAKAADAMDVQNPIVIGHSFGTLVAIAWAVARPAEVAALALLAGYYYRTNRPDALMQKVLNQPVLDSLLAGTLMPIQARLTGPLGNRLIFSPAKPTEAYLNRTPFGLMLRPSQLRAALDDGAQLPATAERLSRHYPSLDLPILLAWGAGDKVVHQEAQSQRLAEALSNASTLCVKEAGHMVHHTAPSRVAAAIAELALGVEDPEGRQLARLEPRALEPIS